MESRDSALRRCTREYMVFFGMFLLSLGYSLIMAANHLLIVYLEAPDDYVQHRHWDTIFMMSATLASSSHH